MLQSPLFYALVIAVGTLLVCWGGDLLEQSSDRQPSYLFLNDERLMPKDE